MKQLAKIILMLSLMLAIGIHVNAQTKKPAATPKAKEESKAAAFKAPVMPDDVDLDPLTVVDQMPSFPGGQGALKEWIDANLKYPEKAKEAALEGRVVIRMVVKRDGSLTDFQVMRKFDNDCFAEAIRLLEAMPNWIPGKKEGQDVDVFYTIPFIFKLPK